MPDFIAHSVFHQMVALLVFSAVVGALALRFRQPLVTSFILAGILAGPSGLGLVTSTGQISVMAELGLALLLFVVGLKLDVTLIRSIGAVALATGLGQVLLTSGIGYLICLAMGLAPVSSLYVAVAITFSSTIIIVKLLSDKRETDSLHGRIAIGYLIVQDIVVIAAMIVVSAFASASGASVARQLLVVAARGLVLLGGLALLMYFVLPRLIDRLAQSAELLVLSAVAWAVAVAGVSELIGLGKEIGAFLGGVSLASTAYREALGARLVSLRDFLLLFFFISLGAGLDLRSLESQVWAAIPLSLFVLIAKPIIVIVITSLLGYRKRTSFLAGIVGGQISEFSLVLAALGLRVGHIDQSTVGLITLVGLVTIGLSTYLILYSHLLYDGLSPYLSIFERRMVSPEESLARTGPGSESDVILFGLGRYGSRIAAALRQRGRAVLGVDFDPQAVKAWTAAGQLAVFGDAEDPEFPAALPLAKAHWVISSIAVRDSNLALLHALTDHGYNGNIAVTTHSAQEVDLLKHRGADVVLVPFEDAAVGAADTIASIDEQIRRCKMDKFISGLANHYIVCGYGRMGQQIVKDFRHYNTSHVVVNENPAHEPKLIEQQVPYVSGRATEDSVLAKAGIERARGLIAVAATDEENVFIVLTARGLNPNLFILARSILQENEDKLRRAGADKVLSPYVLGGHRMAIMVLKPRVTDFLDLMIHDHEHDLEISDVLIREGSPLSGRSIRDSQFRQATGATILAIVRADGTQAANPDPGLVMEAGDEIILMGSAQQIDAAERLSAGPGHPAGPGNP